MPTFETGTVYRGGRGRLKEYEERNVTKWAGVNVA